MKDWLYGILVMVGIMLFGIFIGNSPTPIADIINKPTKQVTEKVQATEKIDYTTGVVKVTATRERIRQNKGFGAVTQPFYVAEYVSEGTGFYIGEGLVITAAHVLKDTSEIKVIYNQDAYQASVAFLDAAKDIAVLDIGAANLPSVDLETRDVRIDEKVVIVGYPLGQRKTVYGSILRKGIYTNLSSIPAIELNASFKGGNSGSPVLNEAGRVIGMAIGQATDLEGKPIDGHAYALPIRDVLASFSHQ